MFTQNQIAEFKEAFSFIDSDKDGIINKNDLAVTWDALGRLIKDDDLKQMLSEAPGPINFTMFLSIFGDRIAGEYKFQRYFHAHQYQKYNLTIELFFVFRRLKALMTRVSYETPSNRSKTTRILVRLVRID